MRAALAGAVVVVAMVASACGTGGEPSAKDSTDGSASPSTSAGASSSTGCPSSSATPAAWGSDVPADLPRLAGMEVTGGDETAGVQHVTFTAPSSFSDAVAFYLQQLPAAGFRLGTGDSEESEADIPFDKGGQQFSLKLRGVPDPCQTQGLLSIGAEPESD